MSDMQAEGRRDDAVRRVAAALRRRHLEKLWAGVPTDHQAAWLGYVASGWWPQTRRFRAFALANRLREGSLIDHRPPRRTDGLADGLVGALLDALAP